MGLPVELVSARTADGVLLHGALAAVHGAHSGALGVHGAWGNFYGSPVADLLRAGPERGMTVLSLNGRGHDLGSLGDGEPCIGFIRDRFERAPLDLEAAAGLLAAAVRRVAVVAHSFGAHRATYWQRQEGSRPAAAVVLLSPAPPLQTTVHAFVEGSAEQYIARAAAAVAAGHPERLVTLSSTAPVPMVAEAMTVLSTWDPATLANSLLHVPHLRMPVLVTVGRSEPAAYREMAERVAAAAPDGELLVLADNHYYSRDRAALSATVLDWLAAHGVSGRPE
jgi:hypothetical protein